MGESPTHSGNRGSRRHPRWATVKETAEYVGLHHVSVRRMVADGRIRGYHLGPRILRIDLNEIDDAMGKE